MTADEYLKSVNSKFQECMAKRLPRSHLEWGVFSGAINRELRAELKTLDQKSKEALNLKLAFGCWQAMSKLLDLNHQSRIKRIVFGNKYLREIEDYKEQMR